MRADNVDYLPIWKKGSTAEENLLELAMIARKYPERFRQFVIVYHETFDEKGRSFSKTRYTTHDCDTSAALGIIELGKLELLRYTHSF